MPIYEYRCGDCGKVSDFLVGVGRGGDEIKCPACGSCRLQKVLSAPGLISPGKGKRQSGPTCCGNSVPCGRPPCADTGGCVR